MSFLRFARRISVLGILCLGGVSTRARAATFVVTNTNDTNGVCSANSCSLREAIAAANKDTTTADTITFADSVSGTIMVSGTDADTTYGASAFILGGNVSIQGPGANVLTLQHDSSAINARFFLMKTGVTSALSGLTLSGGVTTGGQIGGALYNRGTLTLSGCLISGNLADLYGGAVVNVSRMAIQDCAFVGNVAKGGDTGGAIDNTNGTLTVTNSTFEGNSTPNGDGNGNGGAIWTNNGATIANCTITNNGNPKGAGGIFAQIGTVVISNSIVAANQSNDSVPDVGYIRGTFSSGGYNLIGDVGNVTTFTAAGDKVGTASAVLDPMLEKLQYNGGATPTCSLAANSPALNAGSPSFSAANLPYDQRGVGYARVGRGRLDIGAFEAQTQPPTIQVGISPAAPTTQSILAAQVKESSAELTYSYQWSKNGVVLADEKGPALDLSKAGNGDRGDIISVQVTARTGDGVSSQPANASVQVRNSAPDFKGVTLVPARPGSRDVLVATPGSLSDADGDALSYSYAWSKNGVVLSGEVSKTLDLSKTGNGDKGDKISLVMTASDGIATQTRVASATIENSRPLLSNLKFDKSAPTTDEPITATVVGSDADGDAITYTYTWTRKRAGKISSIRSISTSQTSDTLVTKGDSVIVGDVITLSVVARDGAGVSSTLTQSVTIANSPISVVIVNTTSTPRTNDKLVVNVRPQDVDKTPATFTYTWTKQSGDKSSVLQSTISQSSTATLDLSKAGNGNKGDRILFTVQASDGQSSATATYTFSVLNTIPTVTRLVLLPSNPTTTGVITATYAARDADVADGLDTLTPVYKWRIAGRFLADEKGPTLDLSKYFFVKAGDSVSLELRASDGTALSQALTQSVTVAGPGTNTAPSSPGA